MIIDLNDCVIQERYRYFLSRTVTTDEGCRIWQGALADGYPIAGCKRIQPQIFRVHVFVAQVYYKQPTLLQAKYGKDVEVCHNCPRTDKRNCIEPTHLIIANKSYNQRDAVKKGQKSLVGENNPNYILSEDEVRQIRREGRYAPSHEIGAKYGVGGHVIRQILGNKTWRHLL